MKRVEIETRNTLGVFEETLEELRDDVHVELKRMFTLRRGAPEIRRVRVTIEVELCGE